MAAPPNQGVSLRAPLGAQSVKQFSLWQPLFSASDSFYAQFSCPLVLAFLCFGKITRKSVPSFPVNSYFHLFLSPLPDCSMQELYPLQTAPQLQQNNIFPTVSQCQRVAPVCHLRSYHPPYKPRITCSSISHPHLYKKRPL